MSTDPTLQAQLSMQPLPTVPTGTIDLNATTPTVLTNVASRKGIGYATYTAMLIASVGFIFSVYYTYLAFSGKATGTDAVSSLKKTAVMLMIVSAILVVYTVIVFVQTKDTFGVVGNSKNKKYLKY